MKPFVPEYIQEKPIPIAKHVFLVGEIGINHNGDIQIAKKLIDMAKTAGWDAVKFQKRTIDIVYTPGYLAGRRESPWGSTQLEQKNGLEFGQEEYDEIDRYCREIGIEWFASAWDVPSQKFLRQYNLNYNKVASATITHKELLETIAEEKKLTFISTGMCDYLEMDHAVEIFRKAECPFVLMHTISEYPASEDILNLRMIETLRERYNCPVGYSGHEVTMIPSVLASMLGAVAVERHITLDRAMYGSDQAASLEKRGVEVTASYIRTIPTVMGDGVKVTTNSESKNAEKLRYWGPFWGPRED